MADNKTPRIVVSQNLVKEKSFITKDGRVINNTPEDPKAVERYMASLRGLRL